ncbi:MAG TPA: hypothetical protein VMO26_16660 [Vicinamibacterales bacterium]|nr:hypothetical protein [Vicinamibacterales bacterium]
MTHFTPDEVIDAVENTMAPERRAHLIACEHCRAETALAASMLREARAVGAPEPSPLFWDHFSDRVREAIRSEGAASKRARRWFDWPVLAPLGALALLVVALVWSVPQPDAHPGRAAIDRQATITESADATENEERWAMMLDLVGEVDLDAVVDSGFLGRPGTADRAVAHLTAIEQEELVRLLREELRSGG